MTYDCIHDFAETKRFYRYRVKTFHWLPRWTRSDAVTVGSTIYCLTDCPPDLHAHEFRHVVQFKDYGFLHMAVLYIRAMIFVGYRDHWAEREARQYASQYSHLFRSFP